MSFFSVFWGLCNNRSYFNFHVFTVPQLQLNYVAKSPEKVIFHRPFNKYKDKRERDGKTRTIKMVANYLKIVPFSY